jgi:hypothetical protein
MRVRHLRARAMLLGTAMTALGAASFAACESVPDIHFVTDDARADGPAADGPSGQDGSVLDARIEASCSAPAPAAGATCCAGSRTWCVGQCDTASCGECAAKCVTGEVCCGKPGNVLCKPSCP